MDAARIHGYTLANQAFIPKVRLSKKIVNNICKSVVSVWKRINKMAKSMKTNCI